MAQNQTNQPKRNRVYMLAFIALLAMVGISLWYAYRRYRQPTERHSITIFIHGTFFTSLSAVSLKSVLNDELDDSSWYVQMMRSIRNETMLLQDQVINEEGLFEVSPEKVKSCHNCDLDPEDKKFGSAFLVDAYDRVSKVVNHHADHNKYYSFGWSGLLSHKKRIDAARVLYRQLIELQTQYEAKYGVKPELTLVAHSHGGNVAKLLAHIEREECKHLSIKYLVMYGTPIQIETVSLVNSDVIETMISCYSDGDNVQGNDVFSSKERFSKKRLADLVNISSIHSPKKQRYDVRLVLNDQPNVIGHMNMWFMGRAEKVFQSLDPLPLMVLTPLIIQEVQRCLSLHDIDLHLTEAQGLFTAHICEHGKTDIKCWSDNIYHSIVPAALYARINWDPADKNRGVMFNSRNWEAIKKAWYGQ